MKKPPLSRDTFIKLRDFIYEKSGIFFHETKQYLLEDRLARRLKIRGLPSYEEYLYFLRYDPRRDDEVKELFNSITTNETSFFRDIAQLEAFKVGILPKIVERKNKNQEKAIRIWSAGCSTGEEPYTLAMIMLEERLHLKGWKIDVLASDISEQVLISARKAVYGDYAIRNIPDGYLKRYFVNGSGGYAVKPEIKKMVRFTNINLVDHLQMKNIRGIDVIFCRNVLIYFNEDTKRKVLGYLYDSLVEGGFLVVGFSESLFSLTRAFRPVGVNKCVIYQKM